jgi:hypothetical protein
LETKLTECKPPKGPQPTAPKKVKTSTKKGAPTKSKTLKTGNGKKK